MMNLRNDIRVPKTLYLGNEATFARIVYDEGQERICFYIGEDEIFTMPRYTYEVPDDADFTERAPIAITTTQELKVDTGIIMPLDSEGRMMMSLPRALNQTHVINQMKLNNKRNFAQNITGRTKSRYDFFETAFIDAMHILIVLKNSGDDNFVLDGWGNEPAPLKKGFRIAIKKQRYKIPHVIKTNSDIFCLFDQYKTEHRRIKASLRFPNPIQVNIKDRIVIKMKNDDYRQGNVKKFYVYVEYRRELPNDEAESDSENGIELPDSDHPDNELSDDEGNDDSQAKGISILNINENDPETAEFGQIYYNNIDNVLRIFSDLGWQTIDFDNDCSTTNSNNNHCCHPCPDQNTESYPISHILYAKDIIPHDSQIVIENAGTSLLRIPSDSKGSFSYTILRYNYYALITVYASLSQATQTFTLTFRSDNPEHEEKYNMTIARTDEFQKFEITIDLSQRSAFLAEENLFCRFDIESDAVFTLHSLLVCQSPSEQFEPRYNTAFGIFMGKLDLLQFRISNLEKTIAQSLQSQ